VVSYLGFNKLKSQLASKPGVTNPAALAASIGAKKYGAQAMSKAASTGTSLKGAKVRKKKRTKVRPKGY
jgi:hypothetical protein